MTKRQRAHVMELIQQIRNLTKSIDEDDDLREAIGEACDQLDMVISPIVVKGAKK